MSKMLTLADGKKFDLSSKRVVEEKEPELSEDAPVSFTPKPSRDLRLEDLPSNAKMMNVYCAVASYKFLGLPDRDIAHALGCTNEQLFDILNSEAYTKTHNLILDAFVNGQTEAAKDIIAGGAIHAAHELVKVVKTSKNESNRLRAAEGVLNRAGVGDAKTDPMSQGLVIKVVKDAPTSNVTIEVK